MESWHYDSASDLELAPLDRLRRFPREPDMLVYFLRMTAAVGMRAWMRVYHRLRVIGRENLPTRGSFVLVANHTSHLDTLALLAALPLRRIHSTFPAAAKDYFFVRPARTIVASVCTNAMPFERTTSPRQSLALCRHLLEGSCVCLILFPEGSRAATRGGATFRPGIGLVVAGTTVPVVPCFIDGALRAWPRSARIPRPHPVTLRIGPARTYADRVPDKTSAQWIAEDLEQAVRSLDPARSTPTHASEGGQHE